MSLILSIKKAHRRRKGKKLLPLAETVYGFGPLNHVGSVFDNIHQVSFDGLEIHINGCLGEKHLSITQEDIEIFAADYQKNNSREFPRNKLEKIKIRTYRPGEWEAKLTQRYNQKMEEYKSKKNQAFQLD